MSKKVGEGMHFNEVRGVVHKFNLITFIQLRFLTVSNCPWKDVEMLHDNINIKRYILGLVKLDYSFSEIMII